MYETGQGRLLPGIAYRLDFCKESLRKTNEKEVMKTVEQRIQKQLRENMRLIIDITKDGSRARIAPVEQNTRRFLVGSRPDYPWLDFTDGNWSGANRATFVLKFHRREPDGYWAGLLWLNIMVGRRPGTSWSKIFKPLSGRITQPEFKRESDQFTRKFLAKSR